MNENRFELGLEQVKDELKEMEKIRREYYLQMLNAPSENIKRELEVLTSEINGLEVERDEIERELLDLSSFKMLLTSVLDKREREPELQYEQWDEVYDSIKNETKEKHCRGYLERLDAFDERNGE